MFRCSNGLFVYPIVSGNILVAGCQGSRVQPKYLRVQQIIFLGRPGAPDAARVKTHFLHNGIISVCSPVTELTLRDLWGISPACVQFKMWRSFYFFALFPIDIWPREPEPWRRDLFSEVYGWRSHTSWRVCARMKAMSSMDHATGDSMQTWKCVEAAIRLVTRRPMAVPVLF